MRLTRGVGTNAGSATDLAAEVAKEAQAHGLSLAQVLLRRGLMTAADVERLLDPLRMTRALSTPADG